jgi:hypothetical protein
VNDANGNTLSDAQGRGFTWDLENRLTQAMVPQSGGSSTLVTFKYDPFGRRIQKSGPNGTTNYLYDGANVIEEVDANGNPPPSARPTTSMTGKIPSRNSTTSGSCWQGSLRGQPPHNPESKQPHNNPTARSSLRPEALSNNPNHTAQPVDTSFLAALITQRSVVQIHPPQPLTDSQPHTTPHEAGRLRTSLSPSERSRLPFLLP